MAKIHQIKGMQSQLNSQGSPLPIRVPNNQSQSLLPPQNIPNNIIASAGVQGSASLTSLLPPVSSLAQTAQNSNLQNIENISGVSQNSVANAIVGQDKGYLSIFYLANYTARGGRNRVFLNPRIPSSIFISSIYQASVPKM